MLTLSYIPSLPGLQAGGHDGRGGTRREEAETAAGSGGVPTEAACEERDWLASLPAHCYAKGLPVEIQFS